jgi:GMP synthase (glutamine-hydrolysing)
MGLKRILILDNSIDQSIYTPVLHWQRDTEEAVLAVRPPLGQFPEDLRSFSHVIVAGSEDSILEDYDWILRQCALVRELALARVPILASCFGHQLVVRALSGKAFVRRSLTPEFGWVEVEKTVAGQSDPLLAEVPDPFYVYSSHFDEVFDLPGDWATLATSSRCAHAVIRHAKLPIWGFQHHPEINPLEGQLLANAIWDRLPDRQQVIAAGRCPEVRDSRITRTLLRSFLGC